ncbi:class I SAM-dependent methyltransferase [Aquirufa ecclesiirivi]|uniref:class I SAM-dependent methyltransferase n=1 Tax=Aquirufa ecclesiirivi TaxID=2715124 RepID=UPI00140C4569|nr:class I SAM-dependent methyltransferase [Aquirufa ecclesiirivi]MDF0692674.1 class I SAM-dependent methyltransferase [Aquirufa ecclesiirivi]NHC47959.1 class I SAM-dependent methyltransferase [Aquirufa ecclesiirivi]
MIGNTKEHWEKIFSTKKSNEVSWTQEVPSISLEFIQKFKINKTPNIIDIGGGDSKLVDFLLAEGYSNISVLDISEAAILRAKERLGKDASKVKWIVSDILDFNPNEKYDVWHDRAAFHFQTEIDKIEKYLNIVKNAVDGMVIIGTFSVDGPIKCSGLDIKQYDEAEMKEKFQQSGFKNLECKREDHISPAGAVQNFVFCSFIKK